MVTVLMFVCGDVGRLIHRNITQFVGHLSSRKVFEFSNMETQSVDSTQSNKSLKHELL